MEEIGKALTEAVRQGAPIAQYAVMWWYIIKLIDTVLGNLALLLFISTLLYGTVASIRMWRGYAKGEYKSRY